MEASYILMVTIPAIPELIGTLLSVQGYRYDELLSEMYASDEIMILIANV